MNPAQPHISIITINYNHAAGLQRTIGSVLAQDYVSFEYIVIDGGSTDGSAALIEANAASFAYHTSERDRGIYHAMNKGIAQAKGEYLLFINSGDELLDTGSLSKMASLVNGEDLVYGNLLMRSADGDSVRSYPDQLTFKHFLFDSLPHPATFIRRSLFAQLGTYEEQYRIVSDWAFFLKAIIAKGATYRHVPEVFSVFYLDGISSSTTHANLTEAEKQQVLNDYFPLFADLYPDMKAGLALRTHVKASRLIRMIRFVGLLGHLRDSS